MKTKQQTSAKKAQSSDAKQDKSLVRSGVRQHEVAMHKGKPTTKLKLGR